MRRSEPDDRFSHVDAGAEKRLLRSVVRKVWADPTLAGRLAASVTSEEAAAIRRALEVRA